MATPDSAPVTAIATPPFDRSAALLADVSKLVLASTATSALLFMAFTPLSMAVRSAAGSAAFSVIYIVVWWAARRNAVQLGGWIFALATWLGQLGVVLATGSLTEQALVSSVNIVLAVGFILGRRTSLIVSLVCIGSMLSMWLLALTGSLPDPVLIPTITDRVITTACTLSVTIGLVYLGVRYNHEALNEAVQSAQRAGDMLAELEKRQGAERRRLAQAEQLAIMARNLVGMREPEKITTEVAIGLRDALSSRVVLIIRRGGRVLATAGLGEQEPPGEVPRRLSERWVERGAIKVLEPHETTLLAEFLGIESPAFGVSATGPHTSTTIVATGESASITSAESTWPLQAAASALDSAMLRFESESRMVQVQKMDALNRLSSGIAHDFNNLLTTILGGTELLEQRTEKTSPMGAQLRRIRDAGERAASLTVRLMTFTQGAPRARSLVDLSVLIADLFPVFRRTVEANIQLELHVHGDSTWINADPIEIEQVAFNLVTNSLDAIDSSGGRIDIGVDLRGVSEGLAQPTAVLWVQDNGRGMDRDTRSRVFEPFYTTRKDHGATGLGLSIVYGVVQALGGDVFIDSTPGMGTCVEVHLPAANEPMELPPAKPLPNPPEVSDPIMVVEDDLDVRQTVCEMLEMGGYRTEAVGSAEAALALLEGGTSYSLVLSDVIMPAMSGIELARAMAERGVHCPIALISGYARGATDSVNEASRLPRITKPFSLAELLAFVRDNAL